jgi:hypothetical protein
MCKYSSFWNDHPQECVNFFNAAFLPAAHWIAVIDAHPFNTIDAGFELVRIAKFTAPDIVNIGLHFFLKDVRPMLPHPMIDSTVGV